MHVEDENFGENIVAEELQKGYMYRDSVVRHSMVKAVSYTHLDVYKRQWQDCSSISVSPSV